MSRLWLWIPLVLFALFSVCHGQTVTPNCLRELKYPPIARAAHVQGDVIVSFRQTPDGNTVDVMPISGPAMLQSVALENVKAWHFAPPADPAGQVYKAVFHFQLNPPDDGFDNNQPTTKVELDGTGGVRVLSIFTTGLERSECPSDSEHIPPSAVMNGDFVEVHRWNEIVRVDADGSVAWREREQGKIEQRDRVSPAEAKSLLEQFRTQAVWSLCGNYSQAGLMDGVNYNVRPNKLILPRVDQFNISLQQQATQDLTFTIAYVGNIGERVYPSETEGYNANQYVLPAPTLQDCFFGS